MARIHRSADEFHIKLNTNTNLPYSWECPLFQANRQSVNPVNNNKPIAVSPKNKAQQPNPKANVQPYELLFLHRPHQTTINQSASSHLTPQT